MSPEVRCGCGRVLSAHDVVCPACGQRTSLLPKWVNDVLPVIAIGFGWWLFRRRGDEGGAVCSKK